MSPFSKTASRGFTLTEVIVSTSIGAVVMLAMISTYLYLGRSLTRLSYHRALEVQSRAALVALTNDVRKAKAITSASSTGLTLTLIDGTSVIYSYSSNPNKLTRDAGAGPVSLFNNLSGETISVPVTMTSFAFSYYTTFDGSLTPATSTLLSIKQISVSFTVQAGGSSQQSSGTMTRFSLASGRILIRNKHLPTGS